MKYGSMTPSAVGVVMKEMVRRAIAEIRSQRFIFESKQKNHLDGFSEDLVTSADKAAQEIYHGMIQECFPGYGVIAEEDNLSTSCFIPDRQLHFTVDPLDGTKAFARRQSSGISTMISLVDGSDVVAAYVGDIMTQEIYGFRPESENVHRISEYNIGEKLQVGLNPLNTSLLLLRDDPWKHEVDVQLLLQKYKKTGIDGGSIGVSFARLWKQEAGSLLLRPSFETPWDTSPILGISKKLGFVFLKISPNGKLDLLSLLPPTETYKRDYELLVVHKNNLPELNN